MIELNVLNDNAIDMDVIEDETVSLLVNMPTGGGITPSGTKPISITANGTYTEDVTVYANAEIDVNVSGGITPSGTKNISITANGTTTEDVTNYANAQITANVPNTYTVADEGKVVDNGALVSQTSKSITANGTHDTTTNNSVTVAVANSYTSADEGKVVDNGALVSQTSATYTENDTYDTTLIDEVTVNVSGGGDPNENLVKYLTNQLTEVFVDVGNLAMHNRVLNESSAITNIHITGYSYVGSYAFHGSTGLKTLVLVADADANAYAQQQMVSNCTNLEAVDFTNLDLSVGSVFATGNKPNFKTLILRKDTISTLGNLNVFTTTPFASGGTGGTLYVPQALISSYQSATNWSTILGYANNQIKSIESTHTDPTAPIDLTLYYADGTPIT